MPIRLSDGTYRTRRKTPGYRSGALVMRLGTTNGETATKREQILLDAYHDTQWDILDALRAREISFPAAMKLRGKGGWPKIRAELEKRRAEAAQVDHDAELLMEEYLVAQREEVKAASLKMNRGRIEAFIRWLKETHSIPGPVSIGMFTPENVVAFRDKYVGSKHAAREKRFKELWADESNPPPPVEQTQILERDRGSKRATANRHVNAIGAFATWLETAYPGLLPVNPAQGVRWSTKEENKARESVYRYLSTEDVRTLLSYAARYDAENPSDEPRPDALFWHFLVSTGATTHNEGSQFRLRHLHWDQEQDGAIPCDVKGTKSLFRDRVVPVSRALAERLQARAAERGIGDDRPLFPFTHGEYRTVWEGTQRIVKEEKPEGWEAILRARPYDLRHTFAVAALRAGVDLLELMDLMGHNLLETTRIYARHRRDSSKALAGVAALLE